VVSTVTQRQALCGIEMRYTPAQHVRAIGEDAWRGDQIMKQAVGVK
jgi:hypothetical protein